jgi:uncharacterized protein (DUF849 family)
MTAPVIIEAALNGVTSPKRNPNVPATVDDHARDGIACIDAGATVIHTHAPNMAVGPEEAAEQYADTYRPITEQRPGAICYATTGIGPTIDDRYRHNELLDDMGLIRAPTSRTRCACARNADSAQASHASNRASCASSWRITRRASCRPAHS